MESGVIRLNYTRIAKLHKKVVSIPQNSEEREQILSTLNESDLAAVFDYDMDVRSGRIKKVEEEAMSDRTKTYEWYVSKMNSDEKGSMLQVSQFAMENPELYQRYRERYLQERDKERQSHNQRLTENKFKNKPYSIK